MIGLIGATGFTGKLVADELKKRNADFFLAGRNEQSLQTLSESLGGVPFRIIDVQDSSTFNALDGCKIIINCAGPFTDFGEPIVQEAIARRAHYLDTTGEQGFIKLVYDKYHEQAKDAGIVLVPACAYEYAIGDALGAQLCSDFPQCRAIEVIYSLNEMHTSPGTRKSIVRAIAAPGFCLKNGQLVESKSIAISRKTRSDARAVSMVSFPAGEALMLPRHTNVQEVSSYFTAAAPAVLLQASAALGQLLMNVAGDFIVGKIKASVPTITQRQSTTFTIQANAINEIASHNITVKGNDPYWLTAVIICGAVDHLLANPPSEFGAITPAMIGGADLIQKLLEKSGGEWFAKG
ncbi:MAG: saccharopine dehydrogenase NADP-binding domain-containing protein [Candidatus Obscuribacterales bacterium]